MIVRDEETTLPRVLTDVRGLCDEVVIVDTGSTDNTMEVAQSFGARVVNFDWVDDFAAARNRSFDECTSEWILWLDADDRVPQESRRRLEHLRSSGMPEADVIVMPYYYIMSPTTPDLCQFSLDRERIIRRTAGLRWENPIHEIVPYSSEQAVRVDVPIVHRPPPEQGIRKSERNLAILRQQYEIGNRSEHTLFHLGKELASSECYEEALSALTEYLGVATAAPGRAMALRLMAACADRLDRPGAARECLVNAAYADSRQAETWMALGHSYYQREEWAKAAPFFAAAAAVTPPAELFTDLSAYSSGPTDLLAACHSHLGMYEEALDETWRSLETNEERERLLRNLDLILDEMTKGTGSALNVSSWETW